MAVSNDKTKVYAGDDTRVWVYSINPVAILNNGNPVVTVTDANRLRGLSAPPVAPPEPTPTQTSSATLTPTASFGASFTGTPSGTPTQTPSVSPSPSQRGGSVPIGAFAVVTMGAPPNYPVPNPIGDIVVPVTLTLY